MFLEEIGRKHRRGERSNWQILFSLSRVGSYASWEHEQNDELPLICLSFLQWSIGPWRTRGSWSFERAFMRDKMDAVIIACSWTDYATWFCVGLGCHTKWWFWGKLAVSSGINDWNWVLLAGKLENILRASFKSYNQRNVFNGMPNFHHFSLKLMCA